MAARKHVFLIAVFTTLLAISPAFAADTAPAVPAPPALMTRLPQEQPYQRELRDYIGSLTEKDFDPGVKEPPKEVAPGNADDRYRMWLLSLEVPRVGMIQHGYRHAASVNLPSSQFTLATIEDEKLGILQPAIWPEPTAWLANWDYAGNPYHGSRALKLRAFVAASVDMLMMDNLQLHSKMLMHHRSDWLGPHLLMYGYTYGQVRDAIDPKGRTAFEACLKGMMKRVHERGPQGDEGYLDICAVTAMRVDADALKDAESLKWAEDYAHRFFNDPWYYNPAGYFPEQGCFDAGFNGLSLYYATWLALASPDWAFVQTEVKKAWRLRGFLALPEPDGTFVGPSHTNSRTGSDVVGDQWDFPLRVAAAAMVTDDAECQAPLPDSEKLEGATKAVITKLAPMVADHKENPNLQRTNSGVWRWMLYPDTPDFPMVNYAFDFYTKGHFAHREELEKNHSPLLKSPFLRDGSFVESFGKAFLIAKKPTFGVIVHSGPVSEFKGEGHVEFTGPYGLSGGSLSAFWTPATGSVILGRRAGMQFPNRNPPSFDTIDMWRAWPVHAVAGATAAGKVFTSARIQNPAPVYDVHDSKARVAVSGTIPSITIGNEKSLEGVINYARVFTLDDKGVSIETTLSGDGKDAVAELYEVLPVFLREIAHQPNAAPTVIEFATGGKWVAATDQYQADVTAVRLTRFNGAVEVRFDRPRRVKLSPADWTDTFMTRASCRNVLIDLLENKDQPATIKDEKKISYRIEPIAKN